MGYSGAAEANDRIEYYLIEQEDSLTAWRELRG
jgi:hypothetical protein